MTNDLQHLLADDHFELDSLLEESFAALRRGDHRRAFTKLDYFRARLAVHIRGEHLHLFPAILGGALLSYTQVKDNKKVLSIRTLIEQLRADHSFFMLELAGVIKIMRKIFDDDKGNGILDLAAVNERLENIHRRLAFHNETEEIRVYPLAESLLASDKVAEIRQRTKRELDNLPLRFKHKR